MLNRETFIQRRFVPTNSAHQAAINIVIAYETAPIAVRAKEMSERLAAELRSECASWQMDWLVQPALCRLAATAASQADMIIIAARGTGEVPNHAKAWIESWMSQRNSEPIALVLLMDREGKSPCEPSPYYDYLRQIAGRGNMDFICNTSHWMPRDRPPRRSSKLAEACSPEPNG